MGPIQQNGARWDLLPRVFMSADGSLMRLATLLIYVNVSNIKLVCYIYLYSDVSALHNLYIL